MPLLSVVPVDRDRTLGEPHSGWPTLLLLVVLASGCGSEAPSQPEDDPDPCLSRTAIALGQTLTGELRSADCRVGLSYLDRYTVSVTTATDVMIGLTSAQFDAYLEVRSTAGQLIAWDDDTSGTDPRIVTLLTAGSYVIHATSFGPGETGSYQLSLGLAPDCGAVGSVALGGSVSGSITPQDCILTQTSGRWDNWTLTLAEDLPVRVTMSSPTLDEVFLVFRPEDSSPQLVGFGAFSPTGSAVSEGPLSAGIWTVAAGTIEEGTTGSYLLSVEPAPPCGPGNALEVPMVLDVVLSADDCFLGGFAPTDSFAISLDAETPVSLRATSGAFSPWLVLLDSDGLPRSWIDASENGTTVPDTADLRIILPSGEWSVLTSSTSSPALGPYRLEVGAALCAAPDTISIGQQRGGTLSHEECRDHRGSIVDRWILNLTSEVTARIDLTSSQFDAFLVLSDKEGREIAVDDDGGGQLDSRIQMRLVGGEYRITAQSFSPGETGSYTLSVTEVNPAGSAETLSPPDPAKRRRGQPDLWGSHRPRPSGGSNQR